MFFKTNIYNSAFPKFIRWHIKLIKYVQDLYIETLRLSTEELMLSNCGAGEDS